MTSHQLDWDNLRIFLAVARGQSALEAANRLEMSHSTVTRRLHRLESEIGARLFDRTTHGHLMTPMGHRLLDHAKTIEHTLAAVEAEIGGDSRSLAGQVRVGAPQGLGSCFLGPQLAEFGARHPRITIDLLTLARVASMSRREADLAVSAERPESGSHIVCKLADYRLRIYATRKYVDSHEPIAALADLRQHRFIGYVDDLAYSRQLHYLENLVPGVRVPWRSTSVLAQFHAILRSRGLAMLPCFLAASAPELVPVLPELAHVDRSFWLVSPSERHSVPRVRAVWDFLRAAAEANRPLLMGDSSEPVWLDAT